MRIGELEEKLLKMFPASATESWDRTGMLVGDPDDEVAAVAVALDPSIEAIDFACAHGANVLVTHHPMFLQPPEMVKPAGNGHDAVGARIWHSVKSGVSILSFHTALDANPRAASVLATPLGLELSGEILECTPDHDGFGYGQICEAPQLTGAQLRDACAEAFGGTPRIWGEPNRVANRLCLWTGAAGEAALKCVKRRIDVLICGEVRYHTAIDACESGLCIVELGHDVSEQPHCAVLVKSLQDLGIPDYGIHLMPLPDNWR